MLKYLGKSTLIAFGFLAIPMITIFVLVVVCLVAIVVSAAGHQ
jgi:hypothetical protein